MEYCNSNINKYFQKQLYNAYICKKKNKIVGLSIFLNGQALRVYGVHFHNHNKLFRVSTVWVSLNPLTKYYTRGD